MTKHQYLGIAVALLGIGLPAACEQTLRTGKAGNTRNAPSADGSCPGGLTACGQGAFAQCLELQNDPAHCGACDRACVPGIACEAGVCQQIVCTGATIPLTGEPTTSAASSGPAAFATGILADVNGDGYLDLVNQEYRAGSFSVSLGQPGGGFAAPDAYVSNGTLSISATDVNADGLSDLLVVSSATPWLPPTQVELWLGHPDGRLTLANATSLNTTTNTIGAVDVAVGDISGDGLLDLLMPADIGTGNLRVCLSDSTGALHVSATYDLGGQFISVQMRDWNGDGSPDLLVRIVRNTSLAILYNRGDGTFEPPVDCGVSFPNFLSDLVVEDFNRDGRWDLALATGSGGLIGVALGLGGCGFTPFSDYDVPRGGSLEFLRAADMNGDGQLDLVAIGRVESISGSTDHVLGVLLGKSDGTFEPPGALISLGPVLLLDVAVGEVTRDQRPDVVLTLAHGQVQTWTNTCQ